MNPERPHIERDFEAPRPPVKKISEFSPEYERNLEWERQTDVRETVFGAKTLEAIRLYRSLGERGVYSKTKAEQKIREHLKRDRNELQRLSRYSQTAGVVTAFFFEALEDEKMGPLLKKKLGKNFMPELAFQFVYRIPYHVLEELLQWHQEELKRKQEAFQKELPALQAACLERIEKAMKAGVLPITPDVFDRRRHETKTQLVDNLCVALEGTQSRGIFNIDIGTILISEYVPSKFIGDTLMHEWLHAMSGRTLIHRGFSGDVRSESTHVDSKRIGARFQNRFDFESDIVRFNWLNEALTEYLNVALQEKDVDLKDAGIYKHERALLEALMSCGAVPIPREFFVRAYFENYNPRKPATEARVVTDASLAGAPSADHAGVPAWHELAGRIKDAYDARFLVRLDKYVKKHGAQKATEVMRDDWKKIIIEKE